ncbi:MAG TPA: TOBE domain-containing protein [Puia sp.]|nr:TOBE domain-containing protein [Puia sp.]
MNQLKGRIAEIHSSEGLSLVKVKVSNNVVCTSLVLDDSRSAEWLTVGKSVNVYFKEIEVIISKGSWLNISVQNRLPCIIHTLKTGEILTQADLMFDETMISSIITTNACRQLNLKVDDHVTALIKTNEINLSPDD